jgi:hypothetical protein
MSSSTAVVNIPPDLVKQGSARFLVNQGSLKAFSLHRIGSSQKKLFNGDNPLDQRQKITADHAKVEHVELAGSTISDMVATFRLDIEKECLLLLRDRN